MMNYNRLFITVLLVSGIFFACVTPRYVIEDSGSSMQGSSSSKVIPVFEDGLESGGYTYSYPSGSSIAVSDEVFKTGESGLDIILNKKDYSGAAIGFGDYDLSSSKNSASLEFWIKGKTGGESFIISLINSEASASGQKVAISVGSGSFGKVSKEWQKFVIPLFKFPDIGKYWDGTQEQTAKFDWKHVAEVRFSIVPQGNDFQVFVDDMVINLDSPFKRRELPPVELISKDSQNDGCALGVFAEEYHYDPSALHDLETKIGKKFSQIFWYSDWNTPFQVDSARKVTDAGYLPHVIWEAWFFGDPSKIKLKNIIDGEWDGYITQWASDAKAFGKPIMVRWGHEFNGNWYPWSLAQNGKDPAIYIKAYRHIHDIFKKVGADNIIWLWSPNNNAFPQEDWNDFMKAYPGDEYVDWVALDGYNFGTAGGSGKWQSFNDVFGAAYARIIDKIKKPIMLGEYATGPMGGIKSKWIENMGDELMNNYPGIKAACWFNINKETDWRLDDEPETIEAARKVFRNPYFLSEPQNFLKQADNFQANYAKYKQKADSLKQKYLVKPLAELKYVQKPFSLSGDFSEWELIKPVLLDKSAEFIATGAVWGGPDDSKGNFYFAWDNDYLYLLADITDDVPMVNPNKGGDIWNGDNVEITFATDPNVDLSRTTYAAGDYQIGVSPGDLEKNIPASVWVWKLNSSPEGVKVFSKKTEKGYILEAALPWKAFGGFVPKEGMKLGFNFAIDDGDNDKKREAQSIWFGDDSFYKNPSVWGQMKLVK